MKIQGLDTIIEKGLKHKASTPPLLPIASVSCREFLYFEHCYPVVFTNEDSPKLVAFLGFSSYGKNLVKFSKEYPPVFASMLHPFVVDIDEDEPRLFYVEDDNFLSTSGDNELFDENKNPTRFLEQIIKKASSYADDLLYTKKLAYEIKNSGILIQKKLEVSINGKNGSFDNFLIADRQKLNQLDDKTLANFAKGGHLELIFMHLKSLMHINNFINVIQDKKS